MHGTHEYVQALTVHYSRQFGAAETLPTRGPVNELPTGFRVLRFLPTAPVHMFAFATCGMASDGRAIECFLLSTDPDEFQVEMLAAVAWYHTTCAPLGLGHTFNFGLPWMPGSRCSYGLLSLPYLHGPSLECFEHADARSQVLWLIPITPEERAFKVAHGLDALESRFESPGFNYGDPERPGVVAAGEVAAGG